jgi:hypothetical protein
MKKVLTDYSLIILYCIVFLILLIGVYSSSGFTYFGLLLTFFFTLLAVYGIFWKINLRQTLSRFLSNITNQLTAKFLSNSLNALLIYVIGFVAYHLYILNGSPAITALMMNSSNDVALLRFSITESASTMVSYQSSFIMKGFLPFLVLLLFYLKKYKLYYLLLLLGCFYSFSLMQKSYIIIFLLPLIIFTLQKRKYLFALKYFALIVGTIFTLSFIANPEITKNITTVTSVENNTVFDKFYRIIYGLANRSLIVPGEMVSEWFETIPSKKPFLNGNGYRMYAYFSNSRYRDYASELYPILRPQYAEQGLTGTVNTASFMYDFANFGRVGLILSGILLAFYFLVVEAIFAQDFIIKLSLNSFQILLLSSTNLTTSLFSGGWLLILLLYLYFKPLLQINQVQK